MHTSDYRAERRSSPAESRRPVNRARWLSSIDNFLSDLPGGHLLQEMLRSWRTFAITILISIIVALLFLSVVTKTYTATIVVAPSPQGSRDNTASVSSSLLQSLPGLRGDPSASVSPYTRFLEGLTSYNVIAQLQKKYHFLEYLYADQWDVQNKSWRAPSGVVATTKSVLKVILGYPERPPGPDIEDLQTFVKKHLSISDSDTSSIRELEFNYEDRRFAQRFIIALVQETDNVIRSEARGSASDYSAYLNRALSETTSTEVRNALATLMTEQQRRIMTISGGQPYAATIIDGPYTSHGPTSPKPVLALALCILLGILIAIGIVILRTSRRQSFPAESAGG